LAERILTAVSVKTKVTAVASYHRNGTVNCSFSFPEGHGLPGQGEYCLRVFTVEVYVPDEPEEVVEVEVA
jgi:hypothetical protein